MKSGKNLFVLALLVGLLARNPALVNEVHKRAIHRLHADVATTLNGGFQLIEFALANQVRHGGRVDHDLERGGAAGFMAGRQQLLRHDTT